MPLGVEKTSAYYMSEMQTVIIKNAVRRNIMNKNLRCIHHEVDLCVVGGGLAGVCTAIAAARRGIQVALVQDRPVLGGNASSEIRMWICGANGEDVRETGIVEEIMLENYYRNTNHSFGIWDSVLYEKVRFEENIKLFLNCTCLGGTAEDGELKSVKCWQLTTQTYHIIRAKYFADCSGDSVLAPISGAEYTYGREARSQYGESIAPEQADKKTMGMSCLFQIREYTEKQEFIPPRWAYKYETEEELKHHAHDLGNNFWWIEVGGTQDCIHDTEELKDELLKIAFGVWDHIKNYGDHGADNWNLDWIGFLPGKRESRRYIGEYVITQHDVEAEGRFEDMVAYAGWSMDDHFPEGFYYKDGVSTIWHPAPSPWGIPLRALYSKNIKNLLFAGRNISVTHTALSSTRVMATCGILGQAVGTAAALAVQGGVRVQEVDIPKLQQALMEDDCYLPWHMREISALTKSAQTNCEAVRNGIDRKIGEEENCFTGGVGDCLTYTFAETVSIHKLRIVFDSDLNRVYDNMPCRFPLKQEGYSTPPTLVRGYEIWAETEQGEELIISEKNNYQRLNVIETDIGAKAIRLKITETWGNEKVNIFAFDVE